MLKNVSFSEKAKEQMGPIAAIETEGELNLVRIDLEKLNNQLDSIRTIMNSRHEFVKDQFQSVNERFDTTNELQSLPDEGIECWIPLAVLFGAILIGGSILLSSYLIVDAIIQ